MQLRASRKALERLRAEELRKYLREQERSEQKQLDESAQVAFAAKAAGWRLAQP
jgi:flagellar biosynthesis chaperone FliJ